MFRGSLALGALPLAIACSSQASGGRGEPSAFDTPAPVTQPIAQDRTTISPEPRAPDSKAASLTVEPNTASVGYGSDGFSPRRIDVKVGQQVTFFNKSEDSFWPASNIHPTHHIYPDFDAQGPVRSEQAWTFAFEIPGFWRYHNHLKPQDSGLVVVEGEASGATPVPLSIDVKDFRFEEPTSVPIRDAVNLFRDDDLLARYVERYGPANTVALLSESAPQAGVDCHKRAHDLGHLAYEMFGAGAFSLAGHECQAGAYRVPRGHGGAVPRPGHQRPPEGR